MSETIERDESVLLGARECDPHTAAELRKKYSGTCDHEGDYVPFVEHMEYDAGRRVLLFTITNRASHAIIYRDGKWDRLPKPLYGIVEQAELLDGAVIKPAKRVGQYNAVG